MGIKVRHDPGIQTPGQMAAAVGLGQKRRYDQQRADQNAMFNAQMRMQYDRMGLSENARREAMGHDRDMLGMRLDASRQDSETGFHRQMAMAQAGYDADMSKMDVAHQQHQDRIAFQDELTKGRIQFEYTEQQKREMEKYAQGLAWIQEQGATGAWSPAQVEDAYNQLNAKMIGIQPVPKYDDTPTGRDQFDAQAFFHDEIGEWIIPDRSGGFKVLESKKQVAEQKEIASQFDTKLAIQLFNAYDTEMTENIISDETGDVVKKKAPPEEVVSRVLNTMRAIADMREQYLNPQQGNPQAGPQPEPVPQGPGQQLTQTGTNSWEIHDADKKPLGINADHKEQARVWGEHYKLSDDETALIAMRLAEGVNPRDILKVLMKNAK